MPELITLEDRGPLRLIGLNRPDKRNAFNLQMIRELADAYTAYDADPALRCLLVFGHGGHLSGGLDLMDVLPRVAKDGIQALYTEGQVDPWRVLGRRLHKPVIVAAQGTSYTAALELMMASDIAICAEDARFAQQETSRGIFPFGGATLRMPALIGWHQAMRIMLTGEVIDARAALRLGLVSEVVPPEQLLERAIQLGEKVCEQAPLAVQALLANAALSRDALLDTVSADLVERGLQILRSEDAQEGARSLMQKRKAVFKGA